MISTGLYGLRRFLLFLFLAIIDTFDLMIFKLCSCRHIYLSVILIWSHQFLTLFLTILKQIPEEEKNLGPHDRLIHVYHFMKDPNQNQQIQNFGDPFLMVIREGETAAEVMERIQRKLRIPDEEFSKVIYFYVHYYFLNDLPGRACPLFYIYLLTSWRFESKTVFLQFYMFFLLP